MPARPGSARQASNFQNFSAWETRFSAPLVNFQGARRPVNCMRPSKFHTYVTLSHSYATSKQNLSKLTQMQLFATYGKGKQCREKYKRLKLDGDQVHDRWIDKRRYKAEWDRYGIMYTVRPGMTTGLYISQILYIIQSVHIANIVYKTKCTYRKYCT
jgi:hypothetical protein